MKRFLVIVLVVVVVLGLVITGGIVYLYLQWPAEKVLAVANDFLSREYGLRVEVSSSKIDWLRGVSLESPRLLTTGGKVLLEGKELVILYDIFGFNSIDPVKEKHHASEKHRTVKQGCSG